ncbi:MAG: hypothetical protein AB1403_13775 [Candidatus Riflebacteria bacterium]
MKIRYAFFLICLTAILNCAHAQTRTGHGGWKVKKTEDSQPSGWAKKLPTLDSVETNEKPASEPGEADEEADAEPFFKLDNPGDWQPFIDMDNQFFPAFLLSTALVKLNEPEDAATKKVGDRNGILGIAINNPADGTRFKLEIKENSIMAATQLEGTMEEAGATYFLCPPVAFRYDALARQKQPIPVSLVFSLTINDQPAKTKIQNGVIRSVNDCPTYFQSVVDQSEADISFMFAAYVNENHPIIDKILQEALKTGVVKGFTGYQNEDEKEVIDQVYAIWTALQNRKIKYSSITTPSAHSDTVTSQSVRFINESISFSQANCVDGSVLLASILYKIELNPFLVITPDHMYLGFFLDENGDYYTCIETTELSSGKGRKFFDKMLEETLEEHLKNEDKFLADDDPEYQTINIAEARQLGILPISSESLPASKPQKPSGSPDYPKGSSSSGDDIR